jgi:opacity protein-like surface antigen
MQRLPGRVLGYYLVVLGVAVPVSAQTAPRTEISGGYQFVTFSVDGENESLPKGWYFDVAGNLTPMLGVVFQVGGNYKTFEESVTIGPGTVTATADLDVHEFLGGLRVNARGNSALVPYGQVLVGGVVSSVELTASSTIPGVPGFSEEESATNFGLEVGGGVNFRVAENTGIRFGVDYVRVFAEDDEGVNVFRFHVGVVVGR